jgi:serine protease AprX
LLSILEALLVIARLRSRTLVLSICRWWLPVLAVGMGAAPPATRSAGLPAGSAPPVPRALRHADADGNRIYDDLETRLEQADPAASLSVLVLFERPLEHVETAALTARAGSFPITARFPVEWALAARLTPAQARALAALPMVTHIEGDDRVSVTRATAVPAFGVTQARETFGRSGDGDGDPDSYGPADHTIAVIDTGIDGKHADFANNKIIGWVDFVGGKREPYDDLGHGTHVASIAAGRVRNGVGGVAPGAALVGIKVINSEGNARTSDVVKGINWCLSNREDLGIRVINLSLSGSGSGDGADIMSRSIKKCVAEGIIVCVAAGNHGPAAYTTPAPGACAAAITVGTMRDPGKGGFALWTTSGRGPTADGRVKPDLVAPGFQIMAAEAGTGTGSMPQTGSSMATPFVAGMCSLMLEANPELTPAEVKEILRKTAVDFGPEGPDVDYGAGRLDGFAAIQAAESPAHPGDSHGPAVPDHRFLAGALGAGSAEEWPLEVTDTHDPIAAVLVLPGWTEEEPMRYQIQLLDPDGKILTSNNEERRSQIISYQPMQTGAYTLRVEALSGEGAYFVDVSCDAAAPPSGEAQGARR